MHALLFAILEGRDTVIPLEEAYEIRMIFEAGCFGYFKDRPVRISEQFGSFFQTIVIEVFDKSLACKGFKKLHKIRDTIAAEVCGFF